MKKLSLLLILILVPLVSQAQFGSYQDAYNYGRQMREQWEQNRRNDPERLWSSIVEYLGKGYAFPQSYDKAFENAEYLAYQHDDGRGYLIMGYMYEMGIGSVKKDLQDAKDCYRNGSNEGNRQCDVELRRMNKGQYYNSTDAENFKRYYARLTSSAYTTSKALDWYGNSSGSSSRQRSESTRCSSCNGTGVNPTPHTGGSRTNWVAHYNTKGNKCRYCGSYTSHYHDRCASCNVPH